MFNFLKLLLLFHIIAFTSCQIPCGERFCSIGQGDCISMRNTTCICQPKYATYPEDNTLMCAYQKKSQLIYFILEVLVTFGVGHFYVSNFQMAVPKLLFWIIGYCFFVVLRIVNKKREENNTTTLIIALIGCIFCCGMLVWQIVDLIMIALGNYSDGNGVELLSW